MKLIKCKRCSTENLTWIQNRTGKWALTDRTGALHHCNNDELKAVKCKYCNSADLHWAEEVSPHTQEKKAILTESYGLPHACDERLAFIAKDKQDKKDTYEAEKKRVNAHPDGSICDSCKGSGSGWSSTGLNLDCGLCKTCHGHGRFNDRNKRAMLASLRRKIWPGMKDNYPRRRY